MVVCIARNYQEFESWLLDNFVYVGDSNTLAEISPTQVDKIEFIGRDFRDHPIYFSDELLQFQIDVSRARHPRDKIGYRESSLRKTLRMLRRRS